MLIIKYSLTHSPRICGGCDGHLQNAYTDPVGVLTPSVRPIQVVPHSEVLLIHSLCSERTNGGKHFNNKSLILKLGTYRCFLESAPSTGSWICLNLYS